MRFGSLFAGIGGFDLALERAGMSCSWQVEIDDACCRVLARHWPDVPRHRDIRLVGDLPDVDVLVGGFPCQDVSVAGRRAGLAGERSGLWFEFHRLAARLRPRWLVIENVPGLLSSGGGQDFAAILHGLGELGYGWAYRVLDAQHFGVAQRRRRVFVVGCLGDPARAAAVLFEPESCDGHPPPRRGAGTRVAATLAGGPVGSRGPGHGARSGQVKDDLLVSAPLLGHGPRSDLETETFALAVDMQNAGTGELSGTLQAEAQRRGDRGYGALAHALRAEGADASEDGTGRGTPLVAVAETLDAGYARTTDSAGSNEAGPRNVVIGALRSNHHNNSDPATEAAMHIQQGLSVRRLTPVECERLQGFPDGWTAGESDSARYRTLGNAVCVPVVEWIARRLVAVESLR